MRICAPAEVAQISVALVPCQRVACRPGHRIAILPRLQRCDNFITVLNRYGASVEYRMVSLAVVPAALCTLSVYRQQQTRAEAAGKRSNWQQRLRCAICILPW